MSKRKASKKRGKRNKRSDGSEATASEPSLLAAPDAGGAVPRNDQKSATSTAEIFASDEDLAPTSTAEIFVGDEAFEPSSPTPHAPVAAHEVEHKPKVGNAEFALFADEIGVDNESDHDDDEDAGVLESAMDLIEGMDPTLDEQVGAVSDPSTGIRLIPGMVPLAAITMLAFLASCVALVAEQYFAAQYAEVYLLPVAVFHAIFFANVWTYHTAFRAQRRFLLFRQMVLIVAWMFFMLFMLVDLVHFPPPEAAASTEDFTVPLWTAVYANITAGATILIHWLILGRGYREVAP